MSATPTPWKLEAANCALEPRFCVAISGGGWSELALVVTRMEDEPGADNPVGVANAVLIVKAVNAYQPMLEALERISRLRPAGDVDACKAPRKLVEQMERMALDAITLAKGETA